MQIFSVVLQGGDRCLTLGYYSLDISGKIFNKLTLCRCVNIQRVNLLIKSRHIVSDVRF